MQILPILFSLILFFIPTHNPDHALKDWALKKNRDGIKVYTRDLPNSNLKELKIDLIMPNATLSKIITVLGDTKAYANWVYKCLDAKKLHRPSNKLSYDYFTMDFPWPLSDREIYTKSTYRQNPHTKVLTIETQASTTHAPRLDNDYVRISNHVNRWVLQPISKNEVHISYYLNSDPGGNIPQWLVSAAIDYGPLKTMNALKERLKLPQYQSARLDWVKEY